MLKPVLQKTKNTYPMPPERLEQVSFFVQEYRAPVIDRRDPSEPLPLAQARLPSGTWNILLTAASFRT